MPCDDCEGLYGQLSRLRVLMEQNFSALLKRLEQQDKILFLMMELVSDRTSSGGPIESLVASELGNRGNVASRKFSAAGRLRSLHRRQETPSKRLRFLSTAVSMPSVGSSCSSDFGHGSTDILEGGLGNLHPAIQEDDVAEPQAESQQIFDPSRISDYAIDSAVTETYETRNDLPSEVTCTVDPQHAVDYADGMATELRSFEVIVPQFTHDASGEGDFGSTIAEEAFGIVATAGTSGTARVTVRSAIRMEDLDQAAVEIASAAETTPVRCGGGAEVGENANQQAAFLKEGQRFETMEDFLSCLHQYEQSCGIALIVADSKRVETANKKLKPGVLPWDSKFKYAYFELRCSRAGIANEQCPFRLLVNNSKTERRLVVTKMVESHHEVCFNHNHDDASRMRLLKRLLT